MKKLFSLVLVLCLMLMTSVVAYAEDSLSMHDDDVVAIPVEQDQVTILDIQLGTNNVVTLSVTEVNGMVYKTVAVVTVYDDTVPHNNGTDEPPLG